MSTQNTKVMTYAALVGAAIAAVLALVLFAIGQPVPAAGLAVIAIAALGTIGYSARGGATTES